MKVEPNSEGLSEVLGTASVLHEDLLEGERHYYKYVPLFGVLMVMVESAVTP